MGTKNIKWIAGMITVALALALVGLPAFAQSQPQSQTETDPSVAHVSLISGNVSMKRGSTGEWMAATVNTPLLPGDSIATGPSSRAEIQLDYSNVLRLAANSEATIADLSRSRIQLQVVQGTADLAVFQGNQASSEVDTPNVAVEPAGPGTYRIDVNSSSLTLVTVRRGQAQISTPQGSTTVSDGQQITVQGIQNPQYQIANARPLDSWDEWNINRNGVFENAQNYNHVNRYYSGAQNMSGHGRWVNVPNYDWCWTPYVNAGWVPYSNGRWVWEPYYGWTWVSYEPWGWAPFHYGRWFFYGSSWFWWPGYVTPYYYPVWGPAWVSFFGFGYGYHRFSFGYGYGFRSIGWCPLGPRDRFHRWWGRGHSFNVVNYHNYYGRGFNGGHRGYRGSNLEAAFSNEHFRRAITTMPADRFGREAVGRNRQWVNSTMLRHADLVHGTLPVVPTRASLRVTNRAGFVPAVARSRSANTRFYSRHPVTTASRNHSFNNQAASIRRMVETHNVRAPGANRGSQAARSNANRGNFRTFNAGRPSAQTRSAQVSGQHGQQGSRRVGTPNTQAETVRRGQARSNAGRQSRAPVVRETPQPRRNTRSGNERGLQTNQPGFRRFGTGTPAARGRGSSARENAAPVFRQNPQSRRNNAARPGRQIQGNQSGFRRFGTGAPASSRTVPNRGLQRSSPRADSAARGQQNGRSNFRRFTPQPAPQSAPRNQGRFNNNSRAAPQRNSGGQAGWNRFNRSPQAAPQRGGSFNSGGSRAQRSFRPNFQRQPRSGSRSYSRPPLRLNKPIVTERRSRFSGGSRGGSAPSYRGGSRSRSAPSFHGSRSAPSHGSRGGGGHRR